MIDNIIVKHTEIEENISRFVAYNAVLQFIVELILEILVVLPTRINHLSLSLLNGFLSFKTLSAISKDKFRFLHEDVQIFFILEILLILGDIYYLISEGWNYKFFYVRIPFIFLSIFNWLFVTYIIIKYKLYNITYQGDQKNDIEEIQIRDIEKLKINDRTISQINGINIKSNDIVEIQLD